MSDKIKPGKAVARPDELARTSYEDTMNVLEKEVRNFLWTVLPPNLQFYYAENISDEIHAIVKDIWDHCTEENPSK